MLSQELVRRKLLELESALLSGLTGGASSESLGELHDLLDTVRCEIAAHEAHGTLSHATRQLGARVGERLEQINLLLQEQQRMTTRIHRSVRHELLSILSDAYDKKKSPPVVAMRRDLTLNASQMRAWFLRNLGHPFPTRDDKFRILIETNKGCELRNDRLNYNQTVLWFINTRRRSGWTSFLRKYAHGDKTRMMEIARALESDEGGTHEQRRWSAGNYAEEELAQRKERRSTSSESSSPTLQDVLPELNRSQLEILRSEWTKIIEHVRIGVKERVGDWIDEVVGSTEDVKNQVEVS